MKGTLKRVMSGVLSVITIASAVAQPITAYAAEPEKAASSFEAQYPELETVKDKLAEDEILIANDYSIDYGSDFDIKVDFSGIEGINDVQTSTSVNWTTICRNTKKSMTASQNAERRPKNTSGRPGDTGKHVKR